MNRYYQKIQAMEINSEDIFNLAELNSLDTQDPSFREKIISKIASFRANVCQIARRSQKKFQVKNTSEFGILKVYRIN